MKKFFIVLLVALCLSGFAFAADNAVGSTPWVDKGDLLVNAGIGWTGIAGGAEYDLARIDIAKVVPLTFGVAARALINPGFFDTSYASLEYGLGALATAHVGFKELSLSSGLSWVSRFDVYAGLGVGFGSATLSSAYSSSYYTLKPGFGIATFAGTSYYFSDKLAVNLEYGYLGSVGYTYDLGFGFTGSFYWPLYYATIGSSTSSNRMRHRLSRSLAGARDTNPR